MKKAYDYFSNKQTVTRQNVQQQQINKPQQQEQVNNNINNNGSMLMGIGDKSHRLSHNNLPSERKHQASSIDPQLKMRDQHLTRKEILDPSIISSAQVSAPNSLKNSKNSAQKSNYRQNGKLLHPTSQVTDYIKTQQHSQNSQESGVSASMSSGLQIPQTADTIKMSRVKSYGNISSKKQQHQIYNTNNNKQQYMAPGTSNTNINNYFNPSQNLSNLSREEATQLFLQYSTNYQKGLSSDISGASLGTDNIQTKRESSPRFLQINLKMFNNYMTSNNPQNINTTTNQQQQQYMQQNAGKSYNDDQQQLQQQQQLTPQILQFLQQQQQQNNSLNTITSSRERIRKARDPISKIIQDDDTLNLISQVSKKSIELQQQIEKNKGNVSVDMLAQINKQTNGGFIKNLHKMKAFNIIQNQYTDEQNTASIQNQNTHSQSSIVSGMNSVSQTIQQNSNEKKRPQSELQNAALYQKCQQSLQNQSQNQRSSKSKLAPLNVEKPINGFSNLSSVINSKTNLNYNQANDQQQPTYSMNNRKGSFSSCSLLQAGAISSQNIQYSSQIQIDESSILEEISPNQKNHVNVLVQLLDEKNKYINQLLKKIDKLKDVIKKNSIDMPSLESYRKSISSKTKNKQQHISPSHSKSRSQNNMQRAKSAALIQNVPKNKIKNKKKDQITQINELDSSLVNVIQHNFDKVLENLDLMKQQNIMLMKEVFLNEASSIEDTSIEYPNNDISRQNSSYQYNGVEDCNYISAGGNPNISQDIHDESYQDYLNNADLDPNDEIKKEKSSDKRKIIKSTSNVKGKKSVSHSKNASVRAVSHKNTARGNGSQSQMTNHNQPPVISQNQSMQSQKCLSKPATQQQQYNLSQYKTAITSYRPPTSNGVINNSSTSHQINASVKSKKIAQSNLNLAKGKKPQIASALDNYQQKITNTANHNNYPSLSAFQSIVTVKDQYITNQQKQTIPDGVNYSRQNSHQSQSQLHLHQQLPQNQQQFLLVEQLNQCKASMKVKDKKIEKHKEFINKLKGSLEQVLVEHKKQAEQLENQKKELRALKCKLSLH